MRAFCTVSAPLEVCASSAETLSPGSRFLALRLLGNQQPKTLYFLVDAKSRVREVYTQTCLHFATQGMLDTELFGLAVLIDGEYMFADPESKLSKYGPKSWRSSHTHGLDANGRPLLELHFRVQFYIESPFMLKDETSRHNYYLQLKYNALQRDVPKEYAEQSMILLAGLALQADLGDAVNVALPKHTISTTSTSTTTTTATSISTATSVSTETSAKSVTTIGSKNANVRITAITASASVVDQEAKTRSSNNSGSGSGGSSSSHDVKTLATKTNSQKLAVSTSKTKLATTITTKPTSTSVQSQRPAAANSMMKATTLTTLPKIYKIINSEKTLRLAVAPASCIAASSHAATTITTTATSSSASSSSARVSASSSTSAPSASATVSISTSSTATTSTSATSSTITASVFPISGSLKRSFNVVAATLSPSSSSSSINRSASISTTSSSSPLNAATTTCAPPPSQIDYFRLEDYLPPGLRTPWAASALRACHRENHGMSTADAEICYIQQACLMQESINAHTFRMRMSKNEQGSGMSWFVVYAKGIKVYGVGDNPQQQITFLWPNITKLSFERKKFEIRSGDNKITLYSTSDEKNKMLLTLCKETHQFSMKIAARLKEVVKREEEENNCLHACYIYSRSLHLPYKNKNDQRISVISSTSSNTTSGIVSDRVHSEDELEIMINTPPAPIAAPSTESLALAHLLDRPSVSRQTSSVGQVSLKELEDQLVALSVRQQQQRHSSSNSSGESPTELSNVSMGNSSTSSTFPITSPRNGDSSTATDSPGSQHNVGSQCSSTCSTVVVASPSDCNSNSNPLSSLGVNSSSHNTGNRRNSTSSSLELGFSHTAQNSVLSEVGSTCADHGYIHSTTGNEETESISGVYTLAHGAPPTETSGVYTMHSSEMTGQSSEIAESESQASSHYGILQASIKSAISDDDHIRSELSNLDAVDGGGSVNNYHGKRIKNEKFRLRADSNVSTSGSFRGDGSDPSDSKHTLLSAEELTELIVGRGTYPCRQAVSNNLGSECDYVTLPLSIKGDSYIAGHQDTAPTDDHVVDDLMDVLLPTDPPAPPQRIDSNALNRETLANLCNIRVRSPPPYNARHEKTGLCGPPIRTTHTQNTSKSSASMSSAAAAITTSVPSITEVVPLVAAKPTTTTALRPSTAIRRREPPPYPTSAKPRPTSLVSVNSSPKLSNVSKQPPLVSTATSQPSVRAFKSEEVMARFITTRPQINILKAHTSLVGEHSKPCYASPTQCSSAASSIGSTTSTHHHLSSQLSQHSVLNSNYAGSSLQLNTLHHQQHIPPPQVPVAVAAAAGAAVMPNTIGIPLVPYGLHATHKSMSSLHQQPPPPPPPYPDIKTHPRTCVLLPVIKPRQYLPPPPPSLPRQPPPPPPPQLATVYSSPLARKQLELYQQQLYSDVDYVIYPLQDPAVSQQEYLDAKQGTLLAAMAQSPPPPHPFLAYHHHHAAGAHAGAWDACKSHAIYRSTPYLPLALSTHSRYASTQNLSDTYVQIPGTYSPLYSPSVASLCSSYEPPPPPPLHPATFGVATNLFARSRSDDNILNSLDSLPKVKRLPPPPPPPYVNRRLKKPPMPAPQEKPPPIPSKPATSNQQTSLSRSQPVSAQARPSTLKTNRAHGHMTKTSSGAQWIGERPKQDSVLTRVSSSGGSSNRTGSILAQLQASVAAANLAALNTSTISKASLNASQTTYAAASAATAAAANAIDIALLREKSRNLDLPLISALCNDRSLLKQTKAFVPHKSSRTSNALATTPAALATSTSSLTSSAANATGAATSTTSNGNYPPGKSLANAGNSNMSAAMTHTSVAGSPSFFATLQHHRPQQQSGPDVTGMTSATINAASSSNKFPSTSVSMAKPRKTSVSHRHPNDKLPPLPMQLAEANNYVMDPAILKHQKNYNPQT